MKRKFKIILLIKKLMYNFGHFRLWNVMETVQVLLGLLV